MRPFLIGTAGHVDHGKTTLVHALTGANTDRLAEEQRRGMSIDLGFAEFRLPSGRLAGIVDVPGHERFLKNMLAGAWGVDFGLLVVAADEGVMPQTREHLAIFQTLRLARGLTVLTKADAVEPDWLALAEADTRAALAGTFLESAPLLAVDSLTGRGLDALVQLLDATAAGLPPPDLDRPAFLPVDRVFHRPGFGVVVTGSLRAGRLREGDTVAVYPGGKGARVRGLQTFGQKEAVAEAGMRTAVNLAGLEVDDVERGDVIAPPGSVAAAQRMNVRLELAGDARPMKHRMRVRVHLGTAETLARVLLWEGTELRPGASMLAQLHLEQPAVARRGDRFVVRSYSPQTVIGGGAVLEPDAAPFRSREEAVTRRLLALERGNPEDIAREALAAGGPVPRTAARLAAQTGLPEDVARAALDALCAGGAARATPEGAVDASALGALRARWTERLRAFHKRAPLRPGMPREELRSGDAPPLTPPAFDAVLNLLASDGVLEAERDVVRLAGFSVRLRPDQQATVDEMLAMIRAGGWQPPAEYEVVREMGKHRATREIWDYLTAAGLLVPLGEGLYIHQDVAQSGLDALRAILSAHDTVSVGTFRDTLNASRRAVVPFLEWCDTRRYTRRVGDARVRGPRLFPDA